MHVYVAKSACQTLTAFSGIPSRVRYVTGMNSQSHPFRLILVPLSRKTFQERNFWYQKCFNFLVSALWRNVILPALDYFHLSYCDNHHKNCVVRPPFLAVKRSCAIALACTHHIRINPPWHVPMALVIFHTATDTHCKACGLIRFQVKWWLQVVLQWSNQ